MNWKVSIENGCEYTCVGFFKYCKKRINNFLEFFQQRKNNMYKHNSPFHTKMWQIKKTMKCSSFAFKMVDKNVLFNWAYVFFFIRLVCRWICRSVTNLFILLNVTYIGFGIFKTTYAQIKTTATQKNGGLTKTKNSLTMRQNNHKNCALKICFFRA